MTWVNWRLQRTESLIAIGILVLLAVLLVPTGISMANAYHHDGLGSCLSLNIDPSCANKVGGFRARFQSLSDLANWFTLVPGLIGVLLAAPFVLDLENGTYRLAWTQSITRRRWLAGKIGLSVGSAVIAGTALTLLFTWWRTPVAHLDGRLETGIYDTTGIVPIGYTLFALGLALALGALWRRSAVSLAAAFVGYFAARILVDYKVRDHLVSAASATWRGNHQPAALDNAHVISITGTLHGHPILSGGGFLGGGVKFAAPNSNHAIFHAVYQPTSQFWQLQLTETALFVVLAVMLTGFAAWWTHERVSS
jgi:hypothetical protein